MQQLLAIKLACDILNLFQIFIVSFFTTHETTN